MRIWVDADACPNVIKDILYRAAERTATEVTLVANQPLKVPRSALIKTVRVGAGFDVADARIVELCEPGDLVVTADIPLAAEAIECGALALSPRGELHTADTIRERLIMRDLMDELRGTGIDTGGPPALDAGDRREFANQLDRLLVKSARGTTPWSARP